MKMNLLMMGVLALGLGISTASCSDDNDNKSQEITEEEVLNLDYDASNAAAWGNYAVNVAGLLQNDANKLYQEWKDDFADAFKNHTSESGYKSASDCVKEILQGAIDIANEVGTAKIGEPVDLYNSGKSTQALYAVESWYSWHSRDDYKNNILSIANSLLGQNIGYDSNPATYKLQEKLANGSLTPNSIIAKCLSNESLKSKATDVWANIGTAWKAIDNIPQPFRNNIGSREASNAMDACADLVKSLEELQGLIDDNLSESDAQLVVDQFVDNVVLPTYKDLSEKNTNLYKAVVALQKNPSNTNFKNACDAWLEARKPWETSEAFLFGPVAELGLDPNMDSWPLDPIGIANLLSSQKWSEMQWSGSYDEENEAIEAAQALRGFHTLEFLLFKDGKARTVK